MSRQMIIGWLTVVIAVLALPQITNVIPAGAMPYVACVAGGLTLALRWLGGGLGVNPLSIVGALTLVVGLASVPEIIGIIPVAYVPIVTTVTGILTIISRYVAGQSATDPAKTVNLLFRTE